MARSKNNGNGRVDRLEETMNTLGQAQTNLVQALANLAQNQTAMMQQQAISLARMAETDAIIAGLRSRMAETDRINSERFARIEAILLEHSRILRALPDAVREKIGFKSPPPQTEGGQIAP